MTILSLLQRCACVCMLLAVTPLLTATPPQVKEADGCRGSTVEDFSPPLAIKARTFLGDLQAAIKNRDKQKVANMVRYPLRVHLGNGRRVIRSKSELVRDYDVLFPLSLRKAIERQLPACLFANYQGVMIGDGEVWFEEQPNGTMKIKTLNP